MFLVFSTLKVRTYQHKNKTETLVTPTCIKPHPLAFSHAHLYLVLQNCVWVELEEDLVSGHVKGGDDFLRVAHQLRVEVLVVEKEVFTVHAQERCFQEANL